MQNQDILARLKQARQAQTLALQRFTRAQERLAQLAARQQALCVRLHPPTPPLEHAEESLDPAFLPENGELELQESFVSSPPTDEEQTERIVTRSTEATQ